MSRFTKLTAAALALAAALPAASSAAENELRGAPQMFRVNAQTVQVKFVTDEAIGRDGVRVAVSNAGTARRATADGRHGDDYRYVARVRVRRDLQVGRKHTVRLTLDDGEPIVRQVLLRAGR